MRRITTRLFSVFAALQLCAVGCAKSGETKDNTTPPAAPNYEGSSTPTNSRQWIGGGPASTGPGQDQTGPTAPGRLPPSSYDFNDAPSNRSRSTGWRDGGMSSFAPEDDNSSTSLYLAQGTGAGGTSGMGGSTGAGGFSGTGGAGGFSGTGGSRGTGGFSGAGGSTSSGGSDRP